MHILTTQEAGLASLALREVSIKLRAAAMDDKAARLEKVADALQDPGTVVIQDGASRA